MMKSDLNVWLRKCEIYLACLQVAATTNVERINSELQNLQGTQGNDQSWMFRTVSGVFIARRVP
jgi:hypothetical protein